MSEDSSSNQIDCPLCFQPFSPTEIERHAARCNGASSSSSPAAATAATRRGRNDSANHGDGTATAPVPCPLCGDMFPTNLIEQHAGHCRGNSGAGAGGDAGFGGQPYLGTCHMKCGRDGSAGYGGYCLPCLNKRGGIQSLRPRLVKRHDLSGRSIDVCQGDLTMELAEAIVNAANGSLDHASGVAGAIRTAAGPEMIEDGDAALAQLPDHKVPTGSAVITRAGGRLRCRHVIHAVGPTWKGGNANEKQQLAACITRSLELAHEHKLISIAIPAISSGIFGFSKPLCASVILDAVYRFLDSHPDTPLRSIRLTNVDDATVEVFTDAMSYTDTRPLTSVIRWVAGSADDKCIFRVAHGATYSLQRGLGGAAGADSCGETIVLDFCNLGFELITPYIEKLELRAAMQESLRKAAAGTLTGDAKVRSSAEPPVALPVTIGDRRMAIAACRSNAFDDASFAYLVGAIGAAFALAGAHNPAAIAVPLMGAGVLGYSSTVAARATVDAAIEFAKRRADLGKPAVEIVFCEGVDTAFFVTEVRTRFAVPDGLPPATTPAEARPPAPLAALGRGPSVGGASSSEGDAATGSAASSGSPPQPPAEETPAQRRARLRAEAEGRLAARLAAENP